MPRVIRSEVKRKFAGHSYRKALPYLLKDFDNRCAYSMRHIQIAGGLEVDHFDPTLKNSKRHSYINLMPSIRHCNGKKSDHWPDEELRKKGVELINPCKDDDYGKQIFENPETHKLVGVTPAGRYHIHICDLNAPFLIEERATRSKLRLLWDSGLWKCRGNYWALPDGDAVVASVQSFYDHIQLLIPPIPKPPES